MVQRYFTPSQNLIEKYTRILKQSKLQRTQRGLLKQSEIFSYTSSILNWSLQETNYSQSQQQEEQSSTKNRHPWSRKLHLSSMPISLIEK
jgi:hypothetical protein